MATPLSDQPPPPPPPPAPPAAWRAPVRWFAAEFLVVVTGILVALGLQSWYEGRRDDDRERAYLVQLRADLRDTERLVATADAQNRPADLAGTRLVRAFYAPTAPPRDSILRWFLQASSYELIRPVTATVEALVTTGELNLIRTDSLRTALTAYLDDSRRLVASQQTYENEFLRASDALDETIDVGEVMIALASAERLDSLAAADSLFLLPPGPRRRPFPVDTDALLRDRAAHFAIGQLLSAKRNMADIRTELRVSAERLRTMVEAERAGGGGDG